MGNFVTHARLIVWLGDVRSQHTIFSYRSRPVQIGDEIERNDPQEMPHDITPDAGHDWCMGNGMPCHAEEESIATDRPDFVKSAAVLGKGVFQLETSLAWEKNYSEGLTTHTRTTPTLLRYGIGNALEVRLETDGATRQKTGGGEGNVVESGVADMSLGVKWLMQEGSGETRRPAMALLAHVDLNSGSSAFRGSGEVPSLRLVAEWELADDAVFGIMPGLAWASDEAGERYICRAFWRQPIAGLWRAPCAALSNWQGGICAANGMVATRSASIPA